MKTNLFYKSFPFEALIWLGGLVYLILFVTESSHATFCPFSNLGLTFCPGCGLGLSIHFLARLRFVDSFAAHPLGIFALIILLYRSTTLLIKYAKNIITLGKQNSGGSNG